MGQIQEANKKLGAYVENLRAAVAASGLVQLYEGAVKGGNEYEIMSLLQELGSNGNVDLKIRPNERALREAANVLYRTLNGLFRDSVRGSFPDELTQVATSLASYRGARITPTGIDSLYRIAAADMARTNTQKSSTCCKSI